MASEKKGLLYEALVYRSLLRLKHQGLIQGNIYWNQTPSGMTMDTDLTIGPSPDRPELVFLISHCTAEHNSDMKFWRNIGEVRDVKLKLPAFPRVVGLLFDAKFKRNLLAIQPYAFDDFIVIEHETYGEEILSFAAQHCLISPVQREGKVEYIEKLIKLDASLQICLGAFEQRLTRAISNRNITAEKLWLNASQQKALDGKRRIPRARSTSLRRGVAKSLLFDSFPLKRQVVPKVFLELGMASPSLTGPKVTDKDILGALELMDRTVLSRLHTKYKEMTEFKILVDPLRSIGVYDHVWKYICTNWAALTTGHSLFSALINTHKNPYSALHIQRELGYVIPGWLLVFLITLLKASVGKRMAFGYSKIVQDIEQLTIAERNAWSSTVSIKAGVAFDGPVRSSRTIEYGLRDWLYGDARTNFNLLNSELALIALVLSRRLQTTIGVAIAPNLRSTLRDFFVADTIETKLLSHPSFQPLKLLLTNALEIVGRDYEDIPYHPSPLRGLAVVDGKRVNVRAGAMNLVRVGSTLIRWVSVSDEGKAHKYKEYCGKAWGLRVLVDECTGEVQPNKSIKKIIMLVDGTFSDDELRGLGDSGWNEIYYPDELDELIASIE